MRCFVKFLSVLGCLLIFNFFCQLAVAETVNTTKKPVQVRLGVYITQLYDLNLTDKSFNTIFWLWTKTNSPEFHLSNDLEITNAKMVAMDHQLAGKNIKGQYWETAKYRVNVIKLWNLALFPFDQQILTINFESGMLPLDDLILVPDILGSGIDADIVLSDWKIKSFSLTQNSKTYHSSFEAAEEKTQTQYSGLMMKITLVRDGMRNFVQYLGIAYLACLLTLCIYFVPIVELGIRISLISGAIFAAVGNKVISDQGLATINMLTLVDKIQLSIFFVLAFNLCIVLLTATLLRQGHLLIAKRFNNCGFIIALLFVAMTNLYCYFPLMTT